MMMSEKEILVLVVEDEIPIRRFLKMTLTDHGYGFREAHTGKDGLSKVASERPDLMVLDLGLPDIDGLTVIRQLREWSTIPIIILSARGHEKDKVEALDAGADDYLTKPFGVAEFLARVRVALRNSVRFHWTRGIELCFWKCVRGPKRSKSFIRSVRSIFNQD